MNHIIEVEELKKSYGSLEAVKDISFYAEEGKLFAFLGPNGAGKSTTIDMICTFLKPDRGRVWVDGALLGRDDKTIRRAIGAVFQDSLLDHSLTVAENMRCRGALYGLKGAALTAAVAKAMTAAGVDAYAKRRYGQLSGGQRRRCDIARALLHTPKILFLDEPTTGLDPQTRKAVWETIRKLQQEKGLTVFLTTHYMEEAAAADFVIVIDNGAIAAKGTPSELRQRYAADQLTLYADDAKAVKAILTAMEIPYTEHNSIFHVNLKTTLDALPLLERCKPHVINFEVSNGTMDDAFIAITGRELRQ